MFHCDVSDMPGASLALTLVVLVAEAAGRWQGVQGAVVIGWGVKTRCRHDIADNYGSAILSEVRRHWQTHVCHASATGQYFGAARAAVLQV